MAGSNSAAFGLSFDSIFVLDPDDFLL